MQRETYWTVRMEVFSFETEDSAIQFRDALVSAFCAMPEAEGLGSNTGYVEKYVDGDDDAA